MYNPLPATPLRANASVLCPRLHKTSPASTPRVRPGRRPPQAAGPSAQKTTPAASRRPGPGRCTGQRRRAQPNAAPSSASAPQVSARPNPPPAPSPKQIPLPTSTPQPSPAAGPNRWGSTQRTATAAPMPHTRHTPCSPLPRSSSARTAPAAAAAKPGSPAPSTSPSPNGDSWPYSTAHPPASPSASAPARYSAGWNRARRSSSALPNATAPGRDSPSAALILLCIKTSPFAAGDVVLVLPRAVFAYTVSLPKGVFWRWAGMGQNLAQTFVLRQKGAMGWEGPQRLAKSAGVHYT